MPCLGLAGAARPQAEGRADVMTKDERRARFRGKLVQSLEQIDEPLADYQFLIKRRPDVPPFDLEPFLIARDWLRKALAALDSRERIEPEGLEMPPFTDEETGAGEGGPRPKGKGE